MKEAHAPLPNRTAQQEKCSNSTSSNNSPSNSPSSDLTKSESPRTGTSSDSQNHGKNNNESLEEEPHCGLCASKFHTWSQLHHHYKEAHPDSNLACDDCYRTFDSPQNLRNHKNQVHGPEKFCKKLQYDSKPRMDRRHLRNVPKVHGFQDINFIDFSSEKFPLVAKDVCEKSLHLSKDKFSSECHFCGRGFPCSSALEIHHQTCPENRNREIKKNKRKSTPKFRPQAHHSESDDSDDMGSNDKVRNNFFRSLHLCNKETEQQINGTSSPIEIIRRPLMIHDQKDSKQDLADIQSIISVTNIPSIESGLRNVAEDKKTGLNVQINNSQSSPSPSSSLTSPNFAVLNLISPNFANDHNDEEAQDCFAAECRRMKLRGEFPCKLCPQIFPNLRALKGHNRVHVLVASGTPASPYRCNICTYSSLDKATLVRHMRSHNGDRPYECAMCNYAFTTKANCERHLRNRHSKMTRDEVKSSIIYHPSEDPINDSEYLRTAELNKRNIEKVKEAKPDFTLPVNLKSNLALLKERQKAEDVFQSEHQELLKNISNGAVEEQARSEVATMTEDLDERGAVSPLTDEVWSGEEALDLRVNKESPKCEEPEDLTKKEHTECNNNVDEAKGEMFNSPQRQRPADISNLVNMYSALHPSLTVPQLQQLILHQLNFPTLLRGLPFSPYLIPQAVFHGQEFAKGFLPKEALGLQMSGGNLMGDKVLSPTVPEKLPYFHQENLAKIVLKRDAPDSEFYRKSQGEKPRLTNEYFTESDKKAFQNILESNSEKKAPQYSPQPPTDNSPDRNATVKMVIKNGVLMPKQKQRRYRTERPFSCEHCSARFTLRSNMERHIKQQHPRFWTHKSRYNVSGRKSDSVKYPNMSAYYKGYDNDHVSSTQAREDMTGSTGDLSWDASKSPHKDMNDKSDESDMDEPKDLSDEEEAKDDLVIDEDRGSEHLRMLAHVTEIFKDREETPKSVSKEAQPQDLASVSKMLDNAATQTQTFQKYFQEGCRKDDDEFRRDDGDRSEEEEGLIAGSTSSDENR